MIDSLDRFLKMIHDIRLGVKRCKPNLDLIVDLKVNSLNQFHSLVHRINKVGLREKYNQFLDQLGRLLNERHARIIKICQFYYYLTKPISIDSSFDLPLIDEPTPNNTMYEPHYNFFN